jgi:hypothetical protein
VAIFNTRSQDDTSDPNADLKELGSQDVNDKPGALFPAEGGRSGAFDKRTRNSSTSEIHTADSAHERAQTPPRRRKLDLPTERTGGVRPNGVSEAGRSTDRKRTGGVGPDGVSEKGRG